MVSGDRGCREDERGGAGECCNAAAHIEPIKTRPIPSRLLTIHPECEICDPRVALPPHIHQLLISYQGLQLHCPLVMVAAAAKPTGLRNPIKGPQGGVEITTEDVRPAIRWKGMRRESLEESSPWSGLSGGIDRVEGDRMDPKREVEAKVSPQELVGWRRGGLEEGDI